MGGVGGVIRVATSVTFCYNMVAIKIPLLVMTIALPTISSTFYLAEIMKYKTDLGMKAKLKQTS